jgi:hypothetical protein
VRLGILITFVLYASFLKAQTLGGNSVFKFLKLPATPQLTALGGINTSHISNDVGLSFNNPALLRPSMHTQLNAVFNGLYNGISAYHLSLGYHHEKLNTNFGWGIHFINYGSIQETDASGNVYGSLHPTDWVMQISASRSYMEKWNYGATLKFVSSNYGQFRSNGIAVDVGLLYHDTAALFSASILVKNMGTQLKTYEGTDPDDLPFDLQLGVSKRLENSPFGFSLTAHHLHQFDIRYNDTDFNDVNGFPNGSDKKFTFDKLFRHVVIAANVYLADKVELTAGYNYLRRKELNIGNTGNGLNGFSMGAALMLPKLQVRIARSQYQRNTAYTQFGLSLALNQYMGLGKFGKKIGW